MMRPADAGVYAVVFGLEGQRCVLGRPGEDHLRLLARHRGLADEFERDPAGFIMGRFRCYGGGVVLVDVCSDLYRGKMGEASPLAALGEFKRRAFETCLAGAFSGDVYLVDMGFDWRVPGIGVKKFRTLLRGRQLQRLK